MSPKPNVVILRPERVPTGTKWELCTPEGCSSKPPYPTLTLPKDAGHQSVIFVIDDPLTNPIQFKSPATSAIYIQPNTKPGGQVFDPAGQLYDLKLSQHKGVLRVSTKNDVGLDFIYQLNFSNGTSIDPTIRNGGGGGTAPFLPGPVVTAALLVGLAVVLALTALWMRRRAKTQPS
jgi:hypothetical protein